MVFELKLLHSIVHDEILIQLQQNYKHSRNEMKNWINCKSDDARNRLMVVNHNFSSVNIQQNLFEWKAFML